MNSFVNDNQCPANEISIKQLKLREYNKLVYKKQLEDPTFRERMNIKSHARHQKIRDSKEVLKPRGRPPANRGEMKVKKVSGRPRTYDTIKPSIIE